ncbi:tRNA (guanosine(37)-N1)-methyltransferase TrmD [Candidatus Thiothrix anitrata]|jgi:tRNA (guanine37-N1)-methyltransferase|uniref:tRNA (guanine-N(1)-)-methyltransferase n=2 Tax=Candidatus Thiothrix anitrata TaxID=2823902 RepID=A0ABX7X645_9GAMM|nr:tRNA (guanosine(37)-N1)-methyltransferase TrmD [Candidatus Thiothrix anitrata]QTR50183.1 tRNA (guanosine(37)-N1)-methyltransferase TrmD [Candidatus Thiothrix anitrata]
MTMRFDVITLFPALVNAVVESGVTGRAVERDIISLHSWNPRDYAQDVHRTVDDRPYGGGPGMVMKADCLLQAIRDIRRENPGKVVYLSPQGRLLNQTMVSELAAQTGLILLCGRYEGIDERVIALEVDLECSVGDYVLSGGELGAMVLIDAVTRLLPGALGHAESAAQDSFFDGLLDCPHYTRPENLEGLVTPAVLKSGNHADIARWRKKQALGRTWQRRPELLQARQLTDSERVLLDEYINELDRSTELH